MPADINDMMAGFDHREKLEHNRTDVRLAYLLANVMQPHMRKGMRAKLKDFLIKWESGKKKPVKTPLEKRRELRTLKEKFTGKKNG